MVAEKKGALNPPFLFGKEMFKALIKFYLKQKESMLNLQSHVLLLLFAFGLELILEYWKQLLRRWSRFAKIYIILN